MDPVLGEGALMRLAFCFFRFEQLLWVATDALEIIHDVIIYNTVQQKDKRKQLEKIPTLFFYTLEAASCCQPASSRLS